MKWNKYTIKTITDAEEIIAAALSHIGINGVEIEDGLLLSDDELKGMFVDIPPQSELCDNTAYIHFYLEADEDNKEKLKLAKKEIEALRTFTDIGDGVITVSQTDDLDWINNWKQYFHQFEVGCFLVVPSWEKTPPRNNGKIVLHIDPGCAFGTGAHETTQLCLRQLEKHVKKGCEILDIGTGSGILSIAALKLGAQRATGTDLDPCAAAAVEENKKSNDISDDEFALILGNIIDDLEIQEKAGYGRYDIIAANIFADVLIALSAQAIKHLKKGGIIITSGILDKREECVAEALIKAGFEIEEAVHQNEWVSITAKK